MPSTRLGIAVRPPICDGDDLIHRRADADLVRIEADRRARQHVHAAEVRAGRDGRRLVEQALDEDHVLAVRHHRQQARTELHVAPLPLAHQWIGSTPFEKNTMPRRSGGVFAFAAAAAACPKSGSDSIQGSASATPMPRRK